MKKTLVLGAVITSFLLSACSIFKSYSVEDKEIGVYLLDQAVLTDKKMEQCKLGTINALFINGEGYVPYFTLSQYASFYNPYFAEGIKSEVTSEGSTSTWTIKHGEDIYFAAIVSPLTKTIMVAGSISAAMTLDKNPSDYSMVNKYAQFVDSNTKLKEDNYATYDFSGYAFKTFSKYGKRFYPLGLLDNAFVSSSDLHHFYNYKNIYATWDVENFSKEFETGTSKTTVDKEMESATKGQSIPNYLIDYNNSCFFFVLDNFYGLKSYYKIDSMKKYMHDQGIYSNLFSTDGKKRGEAYSSALATFDDHHTGLISANNAWNEGETKPSGGKRVIKRQYQDQELSEARKRYFTDDRPYTISSDHKTALFHFDTFDLGTAEEVLNDDGSIKITACEHDSYYNVLQHLQKFKEDGRIENVIIDVSTNGGGYIAVMLKILALLSKDNKATLDLYYEDLGIVSTSVCSVDVNMDGQFTADEVFGNTFNFYIMASECSFSCGNALPCYAQLMGIKIIGETSGGGECAVGVHYLPNSEYMYHSSMMHIGHLDKETKKYTGFESGATPDISLIPSGKSAFSEYVGNQIAFNVPRNLYSVDALASLIA